MTTTLIHGTAEHHEALEARLARLAQLNAAVEPISEDSLWHLLGFDVRLGEAGREGGGVRAVVLGFVWDARVGGGGTTS